MSALIEQERKSGRADDFGVKSYGKLTLEQAVRIFPGIVRKENNVLMNLRWMTGYG